MHVAHDFSHLSDADLILMRYDYRQKKEDRQVVVAIDEELKKRLLRKVSDGEEPREQT